MRALCWPRTVIEAVEHFYVHADFQRNHAL